MKAATISVNLDNPDQFSIDVFEGTGCVNRALALLESIEGDFPERVFAVIANKAANNDREAWLLKRYGLE